MRLARSAIVATVAFLLVLLAASQPAHAQRFGRAARAARRLIGQIPRPVLNVPLAEPAPRDGDSIAGLDGGRPGPGARVSYYGDFSPERNGQPAQLRTAYRLFRQADYVGTLESIRQILQRQGEDGQAVLLASQALFALEAYPESAATLQSAMRVLAPDRWGELVENRQQHYASSREYAERLQALERRASRQPAEAAARFLLGYHYTYLGRAADATSELQTALALDRSNQSAAELLGELRRASDQRGPAENPDEAAADLEQIAADAAAATEQADSMPDYELPDYEAELPPPLEAQPQGSARRDDGESPGPGDDAPLDELPGQAGETEGPAFPVSPPSGPREF